jgi:hypothetical protein
VTVVFRRPPYPATFWGYPVIDGDRDDLRFLDPAPCIVALKAKGAGARRDTTGFVLPNELDRREVAGRGGKAAGVPVRQIAEPAATQGGRP